MTFGGRLMNLLRWKPAKTKSEETEMMIVAMEKLSYMPEWKFFEKYLALEIEASMNTMLRSETSVGVAEAKGERTGLTKALRAAERIKAGKEFLESLNKEQSND